MPAAHKTSVESCIDDIVPYADTKEGQGITLVSP